MAKGKKKEEKADVYPSQTAISVEENEAVKSVKETKGITLKIRPSGSDKTLAFGLSNEQLQELCRQISDIPEKKAKETPKKK